MELPSVGQHCSLSSCTRLDFLPYTCPGCQQVFCDKHWRPEQHRCSVETFDDVKALKCPLCKAKIQPVKGQNPNIAMDEHIDSGCKKHKVRKANPNRCSCAGCKVTEVMPFLCDRCLKNYCLKHRHPDDHDCAGRSSSAAHTKRSQPRTQPRSQPHKARQHQQPRQQQSSSSSAARHQSRRPAGQRLNDAGYGAQLDRQRQQRAPAHPQQAQPAGLSEEEAVALAMRASLEDEQQRQQQQRQQQQQQQKKGSECVLS
ncbi:hypothetical protein PTSG_05948 [Salpingoeca rosetta]|uniref:AN1-type domain-containing protein n=1 Tax=Salpingoeca rosetta (strain ATCC 50818 / BSB-021) TaxID=946362 RepID=F2UD88_SALR5|nr:uncharacterized protein PTSG_05948 [Salpingoeca rosetta]EGD74583.1 hypothetical protein PTSG_05948 [Salpingoeca rosetta]|eukprot:XP_004992840.1 hypothetical protein PTSG_05948 [Salpingoeca rosetta]